MKCALFLFIIILDYVRSQYDSNSPPNFNPYRHTPKDEDFSLSEDLLKLFDPPTTESMNVALSNTNLLNAFGISPSNVENNSNPPNVITEPSGVCGKYNPRGVGFKILDLKGNEAKFGEFPWMVAILRENDTGTSYGEKIFLYKCGASLIHPKVVLTSAHCVREQGIKFKIRAGEWDTKSETEIYAHQDRDVEKIIIHPKFYLQGLHNDIALIVLDSPFKLEEHIQTICLPFQDEVLEDLKCIATGWGKKSFDRDSPYQVIMHKVELPIVQSDLCQEKLRESRVGPFFILDKSLICAGGERGIDTCAGDGGSPLVCPIRGKKGIYQQRGLVAWGIGCGDEYPAAYGNVAYFRNWIDDEMLKLGLYTSTYTN